jgi:hypothetical protein
MKTNFETQVCTRCHGSGKYSFCLDYGDKCFKCAGSGHILTKRGAAAKAYYETLCTIPAAQVKIGDRIAASGMTRGCQVFNYVGTVTAIKSREGVRTTVKRMREDGKTLDVSHRTEYATNEGFQVLGGSGATVEFPGCKGYTGEAGTFVENFTEFAFTVSHPKYGEHGKIVTGSVRVYPADSAAKFEEALAYQDTLTKTGKPAKRKLSKEME